MAGAGLCGEEREDPQAAANVQDDFVSDCGVDGLHEKVGTSLVLQEALVHGLVGKHVGENVRTC